MQQTKLCLYNTAGKRTPIAGEKLHRRCHEIFHSGEKRIKLILKHNPQPIELLKTTPGSRWSKRMYAWDVPDHDICRTQPSRMI